MQIAGAPEGRSSCCVCISTRRASQCNHNRFFNIHTQDNKIHVLGDPNPCREYIGRRVPFILKDSSSTRDPSGSIFKAYSSMDSTAVDPEDKPSNTYIGIGGSISTGRNGDKSCIGGKLSSIRHRGILLISTTSIPCVHRIDLASKCNRFGGSISIGRSGD